MGGSPKIKEFLRQRQAEHVAEALSSGELESGSGLNQQLGLSRPGDTRCGSHFKTILNVLKLYPTILASLDDIGEFSDSVDRNKAESLTNLLMSFDFVFLAHFMMDIFAITHELNLALQKSDQDVVNAMMLVDVAQKNLQDMRDNGWEALLNKVTSFMHKHGTGDDILDMEAKYVIPGRRKYRGARNQVTNIHHFRVEVFYNVLDLQLQELGSRFDEKSKELLICMSCFHPYNKFASFDIKKLIPLADFYPNEFPSDGIDMIYFERSLQTFIVDIRGDDIFS